MRYLITADNQEGRVIYDKIAERYSYKEVIVVSQSLPLIANITVLDNIILPKAYHEKESSIRLEPWVFGLLEKFEMKEIIYFHKKNLSNFEQLVTKILRAMIMEPEFILIYMPHNMFNPDDYNHFIDIVKKIDRIQIVVVEHRRFIAEFQDNDFNIIGFEEWQTLVTKV